MIKYWESTLTTSSVWKLQVNCMKSSCKSILAMGSASWVNPTPKNTTASWKILQTCPRHQMDLSSGLSLLNFSRLFWLSFDSLQAGLYNLTALSMHAMDHWTFRSQHLSPLGNTVLVTVELRLHIRYTMYTLRTGVWTVFQFLKLWCLMSSMKWLNQKC